LGERATQLGVNKLDSLVYELARGNIMNTSSQHSWFRDLTSKFGVLDFSIGTELQLRSLQPDELATVKQQAKELVEAYAIAQEKKKIASKKKFSELTEEEKAAGW
jgi:hypothetical protein